MPAFAFQTTRRDRYVLAALGLVLLFVLIRTAWISDSAYISFRTIDNFTHGYGPVWNTDERVQVYTHPLWMLLVALVSVITREICFTSIILSFLFSLGTAYILVFKNSRTFLAAALGLTFLILSKAFVEYSTSGLENALAHFVVAVFFWRFFEHRHEDRSLLWPALWAALVMFTRIDLAVVVVPSLAYLFFRRPGWRQIGTLLLGMLPLIAWFVWSTWYYGFPLPNVAYAMLSTMGAGNELIIRGRGYFEDVIRRSPVTALVMVWAVLGMFWRRDKRNLAAGVGLVLYCLYVLRLGGDSMSGRLFTVPFLVAVIMVARFHLGGGGSRWWSMVPAALVIIVGLVQPHQPLFQGSDYGTGTEKDVWVHGVRDQRAIDFQFSGLVSWGSPNTVAHNESLDRGKILRAAGDTTVVLDEIGAVGFAAGPRVHIIDTKGLADPLLARLPADSSGNWRAGSFDREIPSGYVETVPSGKSHLVDPFLVAYYDTLRLITRGGLFDCGRLRAIARMNMGECDYLLQRYLERPRRVVRYTEVGDLKAAGTDFNCPGCHVFGDSGIAVVIGSVVQDSLIEISLDNNDEYTVTFFGGAFEVGSLTRPSRWNRQGGLLIDTLRVPAKAVARGYDEIDIKPVDGDGGYSFGHLRFIAPGGSAGS